MKMVLLLCMMSYVWGRSSGHAQDIQKDTILTSAGPLEISFLGHASLMFLFNGKVIDVDPVSAEADYSKLPRADLILVTHEHGDHFDLKAIEQVRTEKTDIVWTEACAKQAGGKISGLVMKNGNARTVQGLPIEAVPAYNIKQVRSPGNPYHPKGVGNGYIVTFGNTRIYIAGDTENTPEMKALKNIAVTFLPMNLPYTMAPETAADAARAFRPKILYPYHTGDTDTSQLVKLLQNDKDIEVRIRKME